MRKLILLFLIITTTFLLYSEKLEFVRHSPLQLTFTHFDDSGNKKSGYILDPFSGFPTKEIKKILSKHPESLKIFKRGMGMLFGGAVPLGIGLGVGISDYLVLLTVGISNSWYGMIIAIPILEFTIAIPFTILGLLMMIFFYKQYEKSFKLFNSLEEKKSSIIENDGNFRIGYKIKI